MKPYIVTEANSVQDLVAQVNVLIEDGYEPQGGISEVQNDDNEGSIYFCSQAMYKPPTVNEPKYIANDIIDLGLSRWSLNRLEEQHIDIDKLRTMSEVDLLKLPRFGRSTVNEILSALWRDGGMK